MTRPDEIFSTKYHPKTATLSLKTSYFGKGYFLEIIFNHGYKDEMQNQPSSFLLECHMHKKYPCSSVQSVSSVFHHIS